MMHIDETCLKKYRHWMKENLRWSCRKLDCSLRLRVHRGRTAGRRMESLSQEARRHSGRLLDCTSNMNNVPVT